MKAQSARSPIPFQQQHGPGEHTQMDQHHALTSAKRKRVLKQFGACPAGYTQKDLEQFLDLFYGLFSSRYTMTELRQMRISDPFDRAEDPRQLTVVELAEWLEALLA